MTAVPKRKIAIFEPDPRICGPDAWTQFMRNGFRRVGCECDVVTFTKKGDPRTKWGRILKEEGLIASCTLVPDRVARYRDAGEVLNEYDLVVLSDLKTASCDKDADEKCEPWPTYVEALLQTDTRWTSALHGRLYYEPHEKHEHPELSRADEMRGAPFLRELMELENFAGFLLDHGVDDRFVTFSERLRNTKRHYLPLPFELQCTDEQACRERTTSVPTTCALGRVTQIKYRHVISELAIRGMWPWDGSWVLYAGAASTTWGPSESYELFEQLTKAGWNGTREGGVRSTKVWRAGPPDGSMVIEYLGAYERAQDVALQAHIHVGITDSLFSGGICEFSTMESIDGGCVPIISEPFVVPCLKFEQAVIPRSFHGIGVSTVGKHPDVPQILEELRSALLEASQLSGRDEIVRYNRQVLREQCDPTIHARAILELAGLD